MPKKVSRRSFLKGIIGSLAAVLGLGGGGYYYAREIEPKWLEVVHHEIKNNSIPSGFKNFKIVQFSDTHLGFQYSLQQFRELVNIVKKLNPDIIFFTGDLMDEPNKYKNINQMIEILSKFDAPFGKFAVYGNHDHGGYGSDIYRSVLNKANFTLLLNSHKEIKLLDGSSIYVIGIDDAMLGQPNLKSAIAGIPSNSFKVLLSHAPDIADLAADFGIQLQLSGHSHGGQIKLPVAGALVKPPYAEKYLEGFYQIGSPPLTLYVNKGIGTTRLPFRFLSRPELTVFTLSPE